MVKGKIELLIKKKRISRINEFEIERYLNFFEVTYKDNLKHCEENLEKFPRWAIISGYYAMHDLTKLFIAKKSRIKIDFKIHITTIEVLKEILKDKEMIRIMEESYGKFLTLAQDLEEAKKQRIKAQYYTGSKYMNERYKKLAEEFYNSKVMVYINKLKELLNDTDF